jgi:hypothetical protein
MCYLVKFLDIMSAMHSDKQQVMSCQRFEYAERSKAQQRASNISVRLQSKLYNIALNVNILSVPAKPNLQQEPKCRTRMSVFATL